MTAPVRIDASAWGDLRFATLARLCGFADAEHALIKCAKIWSWQTEHYTEDQPTYAVDSDIVESALGAGGAQHLVRARLAEETPDGLRIRGAVGRIEWLWKSRKASKKGGDATKRKHSDKDGPDGLGSAGPAAPKNGGLTPGPLTLPPDPDLSLRRSGSSFPELLDPAIARVERVEPAPITPLRLPVPPAHDPRVRLNSDAWIYAAKEHQRLREEGIGRDAMPFGALPFGAPARELAARTQELLARTDPPDFAATAAAHRHRVDVAAAEARREQHARWFVPTKLWDAQQFARALETTLSAAGQPRAPPPPRGSQPPSPSTPPPRRLKDLT